MCSGGLFDGLLFGGEVEDLLISVLYELFVLDLNLLQPDLQCIRVLQYLMLLHQLLVLHLQPLLALL